jgi:hypothetical protein
MNKVLRKELVPFSHASLYDYWKFKEVKNKHV